MKPEAKVRKAIIEYLELRRWKIKITVMGKYMSGLPDLYCSHKQYGIRWIEVKNPNMKGSKFTVAQKKEFPEWVANGTPIYILTAGNDEEYSKLFKECNLFDYMLRGV